MDRDLNVLLIGGCPRSGTTMLGAMLGNSAGAITTQESPFKYDMLRRDWPRDPEAFATAFTDWLGRHWRFRSWACPPPSPDELRAIAAQDGTPPDERLGQAVFATVRAYARSLGQADGTSFWPDHSPQNVQHARCLLRAFPKARFVHLVRDPRGIAASVLPLDWGPKNAYDAGRWWLMWVATGLALEAAMPERVIRVRYEDVLADPEREIRRICTLCGIAFDPRMLEPKGLKVPVYTRDQHRLVGGAIDRSKTEDWRRRLAPRDIELVEAAAGEAMEHLGYERTSAAPRPPSGRERLFTKLGDVLWREPLGRLRARKRRRRIG